MPNEATKYLFDRLPYSLFTTFMLILGEMKYPHTVFKYQPLPYPGISYVVYVIFCVCMPIIIKNLLVSTNVSGAEPGEGKWVNFHPTFFSLSLPPFFSYPSNIDWFYYIITKIHLHFKILDPRLRLEAPSQPAVSWPSALSSWYLISPV